MKQERDYLYTAAIVFVLILTTFFGLKQIYVSNHKNISLFRQSKHLQGSMNIAVGLSKCGVYPYNPIVTVHKKVKDLSNSSKIDELGEVDCNKSEFEVVPDLGYSLLLSTLIYLGQVTSFDMTVSLFILKMFMVVGVFLLLSKVYGKVHALLVTVCLSIAVVLLQEQMFGARLLMVNHNYTWIIYVMGVILAGCSIFRNRFNWFLVIFTSLFIGYISILRSGDFYLIMSSIFLTTLLFVIRESFQNVKKQLILASILMIGVLGTHFLHEAYIKTKMVNGFQIYNHSIIHPIILGLGQPDTPFSRKYHYKWSEGDYTTLKLAQRINPEVLELDSDKFNKVLFTLYIDSWIKQPGLMLKSYYIKATSLLGGNKKWIYWLLLCSLIILMMAKDYIGLFFCVATIGKISETIIIFPTPYRALYHQYIPAMMSILVIFSFLAMYKILFENNTFLWIKFRKFYNKIERICLQPLQVQKSSKKT